MSVSFWGRIAGGLGVLLLSVGCVEVPKLHQNNPCDPAVGGECIAEVSDGMPNPDSRVRDTGAPRFDMKVPTSVDTGPDAGINDAGGAGLGDAGCDPGDADALVRECHSEALNGLLGIGRCRGGSMRCAEGIWGECVGEILPRAEACNGLDDDCDNSTDEELVDCNL